MKTVVSKAFPCINYILVPISFQETGPKGPKISILYRDFFSVLVRTLKNIIYVIFDYRNYNVDWGSLSNSKSSILDPVRD